MATAETAVRRRDGDRTTPALVRLVHRWVVVTLATVMAVELVLVLVRQQWMTAFLILAIIALTFLPIVLGRRLPVRIPPEFQVLAITFAFASLFLGEVHNFYEHFWWWDIVLHVSSGLLLGLTGFLLVYSLNEHPRVGVRMRPGLVALFAFCFAFAAGALWEIFEFSMDSGLGLTMQKPKYGDSSGLSDTMWDLIVDALGALLVSVLGWRRIVDRQRSVIDRGVAWLVASARRSIGR